MNDPRNELIINDMRQQQNNFFGDLLKIDSKNLLHDIEPFRNKLLRARNSDITLANKFIPWLESELIDSSRSTIYLEYLETLYREDAYKRHLEEKAKGPKLESKDKQQRAGPSTEDTVDNKTLVRRQQIFDKLRAHVRNISMSKGSEANQYKSIVDEVHINIKNPLEGLIRQLLEDGRKLKPIIQRRDPVQVEGVKACKMFVHCIKGENVPVRREFAQMAK